MDAPEPTDETAGTANSDVPSRPAARRGSAAFAGNDLQEAVGERYRLGRELGKGGFGLVVEACDTLTGATVCIKFLAPQHAHGFALVRFKREFRTARRLRHPACVQVYELARRNHLWFFTMERVLGASMRANGELRGNVPAVVSVALQMLAALDEVHSRAIVHRDIKPDNILVEPARDGRAPVAKLADFGIARVGDLDDDETAWSVRGSPPYLAPELLSDGVTDARSDLYALGVTLYEALAGRHPLSRQRRLSIPAWLSTIRNAAPAELTEIAPEVPGPVAGVIMRLLAKDPRQRYRTASHAHDELAAWLGQHPSPPGLPVLPPLTGSPYLAAPRLVGRDHECTQIETFLTANLTASPTSVPDTPLLFLSGAPGVGKSRLVSWLTRAAQTRGAGVLLARCRQEIGKPLESVSTILARLQNRARPASTPDRSLDTVGTESVSEPLVQPDSVTTAPELPQPAPLPSRPASLSVAALENQVVASEHGLRQLLHELTEQLLASIENTPTLLVIEDLQWSDLETLELIKLWARAVAFDRAAGRALPLAIVATHRPANDLADLRYTRRELIDEGKALAIDLEGFSPVHTVNLVAELLMEAPGPALSDLCARLFGAGEATPLYVSQVLRLLLSRGHLTQPGQRWDGCWRYEHLDDVHLHIPTTVEAAIGERAARLSADTKVMLSVAAVFGRRFSLPLVGEASRLQDDLVRECCDEAGRAGFIAQSSDDDEVFLFAHDRFREALYDALSPAQLRDLHAAAAAALFAHSPNRGRDVAADLTMHFRRAGDHRRAFAFGVVAGEQAFRHRQFHRAADLLDEAVASADVDGQQIPTRVLERLGDAASVSIQVDRAERAYHRLLQSTSDEVRRIRYLTRLGELYDRAQQPTSAASHYNQALALGLPWYLRGPAVARLWLVCLLPAALFLPPPRLCAIVDAIFGRLKIDRLEVIHEAARAACVPAWAYGRPRSSLVYGLHLVGSGIALRDRGTGEAFGISCTALEVVQSVLGRDAAAQRWVDLGATVAFPTDPAAAAFRSTFSGAAAMFLGDGERSLANLNRAVELATELKDPSLLGITAMAAFHANRLFGRQGAAALPRTLRRFAEMEHVPALLPKALEFEAIDQFDRGEFARATELFRSPELQAGPTQGPDVAGEVIRGFYRAYSELMSGALPAEQVAAEAFALITKSEKHKVFIPSMVIDSLAFALAVLAASRLESISPGLHAALARVRRKPRPLARAGRWRRTAWLTACAMHDALIGKPQRAERNLREAIGRWRRYPMRIYRFHLLFSATEVFAAGGPLHRLACAELDDLCAQAPHYRDYLARRTNRA
jgi:serine/threonine protein kinase/tetratricopeptide (TPR) repeat protein